MTRHESKVHSLRQSSRVVPSHVSVCVVSPLIAVVAAAVDDTTVGTGAGMELELPIAPNQSINRENGMGWGWSWDSAQLDKIVHLTSLNTTQEPTHNNTTQSTKINKNNRFSRFYHPLCFCVVWSVCVLVLCLGGCQTQCITISSGASRAALACARYNGGGRRDEASERNGE